MTQVTTPDNIPSPDLTDQYALTQDMAALADGTQRALTRRANLYTGTANQRIAFSTATEGVHWQDTDGSKLEYVRKSGKWESLRAFSPISVENTGSFSVVNTGATNTALAGGLATSATLSRPERTKVRVDFAAGGSNIATGISLGVQLSGAVTTTVSRGGPNAVYLSAPGRGSSFLVLDLPAGSTTFTLVAGAMGAAGARVLTEASLLITPLD